MSSEVVERIEAILASPHEQPAATERALRDCLALISSLVAESESLAKDLAAQIAGHQLTARQSTDSLMRANTATAKLDEVETRARKHWQSFTDLRSDIIGRGPMCRDCADENGRCPTSGQPCDPDEAVKEQIANWRTAERLLAEARERMTRLDNTILRAHQRSNNWMHAVAIEALAIEEARATLSTGGVNG